MYECYVYDIKILKLDARICVLHKVSYFFTSLLLLQSMLCTLCSVSDIVGGLVATSYTPHSTSPKCSDIDTNAIFLV